MSDPGFKDLFDTLPSWARHAISFGMCTGGLVVMFFLFIWNPQQAAAAADTRQDATAARQQEQIDRLSEAMSTLSQTQAVQTGTIANMQRLQDRTDESLNRIEDKIDRLRQGR